MKCIGYQDTNIANITKGGKTKLVKVIFGHLTGPVRLVFLLMFSSRCSSPRTKYGWWNSTSSTSHLMEPWPMCTALRNPSETMATRNMGVKLWAKNGWWNSTSSTSYLMEHWPMWSTLQNPSETMATTNVGLKQVRNIGLLDLHFFLYCW